MTLKTVVRAAKAGAIGVKVRKVETSPAVKLTEVRDRVAIAMKTKARKAVGVMEVEMDIGVAALEAP